MAGETAQRLGSLEPMLEQLRGQLDEVARDIRAGEQWIGDVRQHAVQGVAELVEQGVRLVEAEQAWLTGAAAGETHHVDDDLLVTQRAHPGAAVFGVPREIVADEQRDRRAVRADRRPGARVRVWQSHVVAGDEGDAEQAMGDVEGGGDHRLERQIRLELALVDVVERLAALLGIVAPVPGFELEIAALGGDHRL